MMKQIVVLVCAFLAVQVKAGLVDEVKQELENLRAVVQGDIMVAHDNLDTTQVDFVTYADNTEQSGRISLEENHQNLRDEITTLNDLAWAAGKDPTACTDTRTLVIDLMLEDYRNASRSCIQYQNNEERRIIRDARYIVDVAINKVHDLDFQVNRCNGEILCLSPISTEIGLDMVRLPQNIRTEVSAAGSLSVTLKLKVKDCADHRIAQYAAEGTNLLQAMAVCVNNLLDSRV